MSGAGSPQKVAVCLGELLVDFLAEGAGAPLHEARRFLKSQGGAMANVAAGLARLGVRSRFIGKVGADPFGRFLRDALIAEGVDPTWLKVSDRYPTGLVFVALDEKRVPSFCFFGDPSADMMLAPDEVGPETLHDAGFLHLGTVSMVREPARGASFKLLHLARELQVRVSFDPNFRLHLWSDHELLRDITWQAVADSDLVKLGEGELGFLTGGKDLRAGARMILDRGPEVVVVTRGPEGAYFLGREGEGELPGFKVEVKDTTGAGDAFAAGLIAELMGRVWPPPIKKLEPAVCFANACAALTCAGYGAVEPLPRRHEVEELISSSNGKSK